MCAPSGDHCTPVMRRVSGVSIRRSRGSPPATRTSRNAARGTELEVRAIRARIDAVPRESKERRRHLRDRRRAAGLNEQEPLSVRARNCVRRRRRVQDLCDWCRRLAVATLRERHGARERVRNDEREREAEREPDHDAPPSVSTVGNSDREHAPGARLAEDRAAGVLASTRGPLGHGKQMRCRDCPGLWAFDAPRLRVQRCHQRV